MTYSQNLSQKINKLFIFGLILAIGLGFFIAPIQAEETAYGQIGQFGVPVNSITIDGEDAYFASNIIGTSEEGNTRYKMRKRLKPMAGAGKMCVNT